VRGEVTVGRVAHDASGARDFAPERSSMRRSTLAIGEGVQGSRLPCMAARVVKSALSCIGAPRSKLRPNGKGNTTPSRLAKFLGPVARYALHLVRMNIARLIAYLVVGLLIAILLQSLAIRLFG
jgi:hypothetical protein